MMETKAKYHHLVPQTYMSAWANGSGSLKVRYLNNPCETVVRNKSKIAGVKDYHSIKAGMPICTEDDTAQIFACLAGFNVELDGVVLKTPLEMNRSYREFERWVIADGDGHAVSKKRFYNDIEQIKIRDIEQGWAQKYENHWPEEVARIKDRLSAFSHDGDIPEFDKEYLTTFYTALNWRGFCSRDVFEETLRDLASSFKGVELPEKERIYKSCETAYDEIRHWLLLKYYRDYLNDSGVIYEDAMVGLGCTTFCFLVANGQVHFSTSDTPAFTYDSEEGLIGVLPITPKILMLKMRCVPSDGKYRVLHVDDDTVRCYNYIISENAQEFIIEENT